MPSRSLFNLHVDGKWYRWLYGVRGYLFSPDSSISLEEIRRIISTSDISSWQSIPFPSSGWGTFKYLFTIDQDRGYLKLTEWKKVNGVRTRLVRKADLEKVQDTSVETLGDVFEDANETEQVTSDDSPYVAMPICDKLHLKIGMPSALNELQCRLFTHFVYKWRYYLDDTAAWERPCPQFRTFAIAILRIAAWDLEVVSHMRRGGIRIQYPPIPSWTAPDEDMFWFHGFLVIFHGVGQMGKTVNMAVLKAREMQPLVRIILLSLRDITLVEVSGDTICCSSTIPLITNDSVVHYSPGFRLLTYILTSSCWKPSMYHGERWGVYLPFEIRDMILHNMESRDIISFAQASFTVQEWYYSSIPQVGNLKPQNFDVTISCCGNRHLSNVEGICCSVCYAWHHLKCIPNTQSLNDKYICSHCQQNQTCTALDTDGIYETSHTKSVERGHGVVVDGCTQKLCLCWLYKRLPEIPQRGGSSLRAVFRAVDYSISFNGAFSGLAYGVYV